MTTNAKVIALAILALTVLVIPTAADETGDAVRKLLATRAASQVMVEFDLKKTDGTGGQEVKLQGTIVGADGLVLVTGAKKVDPPVGSRNDRPASFKVRFPGDKKVGATFIGKDEDLNLALLHLDMTDKELPAFQPTAFAEKATAAVGGILIVLRRLGPGDEDVVTYGLLRVSAVIPRPGLPTEYRVLGGLGGYDGCPCYTVAGDLVGFVVGSTLVRNRGYRIVNGRLVRNQANAGPKGHPTRILDATTVREFLSDPARFARRDSWLGVSGLQALTKPLAEALGIEKPGGLVVGEVAELSPAEKAGFEPGDVIVKWGEDPLETDKDRDIVAFRKKVKAAKHDSAHKITVLRGGEKGYAPIVIDVVLTEAPLSENEVPDYQDKEFGLKLKPLTRDFLKQKRLPLDSKGVRVTSVESASWAYIAGIRAGDVIQKMVLKPCPDLAAYKAIMKALMVTRDSEVCYNVTRQRKSLFLCVRPDWENVARPDEKK